MSSKILYVSPQDMRAANGMNQLQHQLLTALYSIYGKSIDLLSLGADPETARRWLKKAGLQVNVLEGIYPMLARLNTSAWYGGGVILCNKLRWINKFYFPVRTPLPRKWIARYDLIVCYYPWGHRLLRLERAGSKVVIDLGDVMANRHERIGTRRWISLASRDEEAIFKSASRCIAVSKADADEFEQLYGSRPAVIGFVPPEAKALLEIASGERPPRIGFMGAPSYGNEEIMRVLAHPDFLDSLSQAGIELVVAGGICDTVGSEILRALEKGGARILGRVDSAVDYYRQICATVNPIGPSTGVKIKSIETLVAGRSLITTRWGVDESLAEGFPNQILYTDWPVEPRKLGELAITMIRNCFSGAESAARAYVERWNETVRELHRI